MGLLAHFLFLRYVKWGKQRVNPVVEKVESMLEPVLQSMDYELVDIEYGDLGRGLLLRIYIDSEAGIMLSDCEAVSRRVSALLDVEDVISGHYDLEVSSPGLDRQLFKLEHYERFVSHQVKIVMATAQMGRRRFTGKLLECTDGIVVVEVDNEVYELPFAEIASGRLVPEF